MKKTLVSVLFAASAVFTVNALAGPDVGVVNMRQLVQQSPVLKKQSENLTKQFSGKRDKLMAMQKSLQANVKKYQRNQAILSKKDLDKLKAEITAQGSAMRLAQTQFQQDIYKAQGKMMKAYMVKVQAAVASIAKSKKLDLVLPSQAVIYAKDKTDITSDVNKKLK